MYEEITKQFKILGSTDPYTRQRYYTTTIGRFLVTPNFKAVNKQPNTLIEFTISPLGDVSHLPDLDGFDKLNESTYIIHTHFIEKDICKMIDGLNTSGYNERSK